MTTNDSSIHRGQDVLNDPLSNKGTAFTLEERRLLRIEGQVPPAIETIEDQLLRTRSEFDRLEDPLGKHIYLRALQDSNEVLFLRFVKENLADTLPIVYTPTVGQATQEFSRIYRRPRGLFLSFDSRDRMREQLESITRPVDVIVATDGQRILGLGDQGVGGMGIPIGKLSLYSAFGGIDPARTLPIMLDVGTDNDERLSDRCYLGQRSNRVEQADYDSFIEQFVEEVGLRWPNVLLQWEDFAQENATPILGRFRDRILSFNDDIQGTAAVSLAVVNSAVEQIGSSFADQRIVILGAGSAGAGIGSMLVAALRDAGVANTEERLVLLDAEGVVHSNRADLRDHQRPLAFPEQLMTDWVAEDGESALETSIRHFKPTVLIGVSGVPGLFTEKAIRSMAEHVPHPIIMPLSNPTSRSEGVPQDLLEWTEGRAVVATGSPFDPVTLNGETFTISQSNNVYIFPGIGLGVVAAKATAVTDDMLMAAAKAVATPGGTATRFDGALPPLGEAPEVSLRIARVVAQVAMDSGVAEAMSPAELDQRIEEIRWEPIYTDMVSESH